MKKIFYVVFLMLFFTVLIGCGDTTSSSEVTELVVWGGDEYVGETGENFKEWIEKFNQSEKAAELKVQLKFRSMSSLANSLNTSALTGHSPDIVVWDRFSTPSYHYLLQPLDEFIAKDGLDVSDFYEEAYNELSFNGSQYGLPLDLDPWGIFVNMTLVNSYNETAAEDDKINVNDLKTWSKVMNAAVKLTQTDSNGKVTVAGINTTSMDGNFFSFAYTGSASIINEDRTSSTYGDTALAEISQLNSDVNSKRVYDTLAYFKHLYGLNVCDKALGGTDAFINNKLAMTFGSVYFPQNIKDLTGKNVDMKFIPFPQRDMSFTGENYTIVDPEKEVSGLQNGQYGGVLGGYGLAIALPAEMYRNSEWEARRDLSWEVIKLWLLDDEMNSTYFTTTEQITARKSLHTHEYYSTNETISDILPYINYYKSRPNVEGYEQFETNVVRTYIQKMYEGETALTVYDYIRKNGNTLLRQIQNRG